MATMNRFALALAALGSGTVFSACAAEKSNMHAAEVPATSHAQAAANCGAKGGCGAAKQAAPGKTMATQASCGAKAGETAANTNPQGEVAASTDNAAMSGSGSTTSAAPKKASRKMVKKTGAQGGCGQGSCG
jgi:hypothetical protein